MDQPQEISPPWLEAAVLEWAEEIKEGRLTDNPRILEYFRATSYHAQNDETPWCAAFICWCLKEAGYAHTGSAAAASYLTFGEECDLQKGAILVLDRGGGKYHVTICWDFDETLIQCLGGNQSNSVCVKTFSREVIRAIRWPVEKKITS